MRLRQPTLAVDVGEAPLRATLRVAKVTSFARTKHGALADRFSNIGSPRANAYWYEVHLQV